jgi:RimJ/RimL family protein N-acetyltransferase
LAVTDKRSHQLVGDAGLYVRSIHSRQGEIGWGVISSHRGQGLATEIGEALLRLAFDMILSACTGSLRSAAPRIKRRGE